MDCLKLNGKKKFSDLIDRAIATNVLSHAYLLDVGNSSDFMDDVLLGAKKILCPFCYSDGCNANDCNICSLVDNGNYPELRIVEPDGKFIKKEELIKLQNDFCMKPLSGKRRVYIIKFAEKMNAFSSNSLLKFLEEPYDGVVAILITSSVNMLLPTIVSRCQLVHLFSNNKSNLDLELFEKVYPFILSLEKDGILTILVEKELWINKFVTIKDSEVAFDIMIFFYYDLLRYLIGSDLTLYNDYLDNIIEIASFNTRSTICSKIKKLVDLKNFLKFNLNSGLYLDKLIIEFGGV